MSLVAILLASLLGSHHCIGMCGGFVAFYSGQRDHRFTSHIAYNGGRLVTYVCLGLLAGTIGRSLNQAGEFLGVQRVMAVLLGALMILLGAKNLLGLSTPRRLRSAALKAAAFFSGPLKGILKQPEANPVSAALALGLFSTFLPCGWLYLFVAAAAASGSATRGALTMTVFWAGTVPAMAALGGATRFLSERARLFLPRVTAALLIAAGIYSMSGHFNKLFFSVRPPHAAGLSAHEHHCEGM